MGMTINTNVASLNAQRNLNGSQSSLAASMQRLSSGLRVNSAKDDAAGLAIAERMNAQVRGMNVAIRNANDGISLSQTAEGALSKVGDSLQRMRELAVQARNATNSDSDKDSLNKEFAQLQSEITRVLGGTTFNGKHILGSDATALNFQVGANTTADDTITVTSTDMTADSTITAVTAATVGGTVASVLPVITLHAGNASAMSGITTSAIARRRRSEWGPMTVIVPDILVRATSADTDHTWSNSHPGCRPGSRPCSMNHSRPNA